MLLIEGPFLDDLVYWIETTPRVALRIVLLMQAVLRDPLAGIGKPEPLKHRLSGCWSRRIDQEHRLVYRVKHGRATLMTARFHY